MHEPAYADPIETIRPGGLKAVYTVQELAERWCAHPESIRRLIREKQIKTLRGFRPFRITFDEIRRYESFDSPEAKQRQILTRFTR